jgi:hypothetical protein
MAKKVVIPAAIFIGINSKQESRSDFLAPGFPRIPWSGLIDKYGAGLVVFFIGTMLSKMAPEIPPCPFPKESEPYPPFS